MPPLYEKNFTVRPKLPLPGLPLVSILAAFGAIAHLHQFVRCITHNLSQAAAHAES